MENLDPKRRKELIEQIRAILIQTEDTKQKHEIYNQFINECKASNLTEDDFYKKVLKEAHKSIDWNYIEEEKKRKVETQNKLEAELAEQDNLIQSAPRYIDRLIKIAFEDGVVDAIELKQIFDKATELSLDINILGDKIDSLLDEQKFKSYPKADFNASTLKDTLLSTNWYDEAHYQKLTTPIENIASKSPWKTIVISLVFLCIAGIGGYYVYNNIRNKSLGEGAKPIATINNSNNTSDSKPNPTGNNPNISSNNSEYSPGFYKCKNNRGYFYNSPEFNNRTKAYLVLGDMINIETISNDKKFGYGVFTNSLGQETKGWLELEDLDFKSSNISNSSVPGKYPIGSQRRINENDLRGLSQRELLIMKNEIYARNGYKFSLVPWVVDYFNSQSWYVNSANSNTNATDVYNEMNEDEKYNIDFIGKYIH